MKPWRKLKLPCKRTILSSLNEDKRCEHPDISLHCPERTLLQVTRIEHLLMQLPVDFSANLHLLCWQFVARNQQQQPIKYCQDW